MKHYVVHHSWASEDTGACGYTIIGVTHSVDAAKRIFDNELVNERRYTEKHGYDILVDKDWEFEAAIIGEYMLSHTHLMIEEFEVLEEE